jgi:hypothetical protein
MMKTLNMTPVTDESLRMLSPQNEINKSTKIQQILGLNEESGNASNTNASAVSR